MLSKSPADKPCNERKRVCADMLAPPSDQCDPTVLKLRHLFQESIQQGKESGTICSELFILISMICSIWTGDVQRIEGVNSIIKFRCKRFKRVSLPLLDARVCLIKHLGLGVKNVSRRFSALAPEMSSTVSDAMNNLHEHVGVLGDLTRWKSAEAIRHIKDFTHKSPIEIEFGAAALGWASPNSSKFVWMYRK